MPHLIALILEDDDDTQDMLGVVAAAVATAITRAPLTAVVVGRNPSNETAVAALAAGATQVLLLPHPDLHLPPQADQLVTLIAAWIERQPRCNQEQALFMLPAGPLGEELAARLAARVEGAPLGRCESIEIVGNGVTARRRAYGDRVELALGATNGPYFAAVRRPSAAPFCRTHKAELQEHGPVQEIRVDVTLPQANACAVPSAPGEAGLNGAKIIVAGGRGMEGAEGFGLLRDVAVALGGAVGGSLPTIDAGWLPVSRQIGQSGRFVSPELYVAVAISGTPQHMAGVAESTTIVALNVDPDADIFRRATIGVVADWKDFLPALLAQLRSAP
jgi:electron transfer flavoprotein alpha subunit